jgi:hypothetical protein
MQTFRKKHIHDLEAPILHYSTYNYYHVEARGLKT